MLATPFDEEDAEGMPVVHWSQREEVLTAWVNYGHSINATHLIIVGEGELIEPVYVLLNESVERIMQLMYIAGHPEDPISLTECQQNGYLIDP